MNQIISIFLLITFSIFVNSCAPEIETIKPTIQNVVESVYASAFVKTKNQYEVYGPANTIIKEIYMKEGDQISAGEPLFQLNNKDLKIATENARLLYEASSIESNRIKLENSREAIKLAQKQLTNDSILFERQKSLWNQKIGSQIDYENRKLKLENAKVRLKDAKTAYYDLTRQLELEAERSRNNLKIAKLKEDDLYVKSEIDGIIYKINVEVGEIINARNPLAIIGTEKFILDLNIDEFDILKIKKGQKVIVRMDSYQDQVFEASITSIDKIMNPRTRTFGAEAEFIEKPKILYPNLTAELNIIIDQKENVLTIPRAYLKNDSTVILKNGAHQIIKTGLKDYDWVEITEGLNTSMVIQRPEE